MDDGSFNIFFDDPAADDIRSLKEARQHNGPLIVSTGSRFSTSGFEAVKAISSAMAQPVAIVCVGMAGE